MNKKYLVIALGLSSSMGLVGCNDDNSSGNSTVNPATPSTPATSYSVTAIDGYLKNAQVWLDLDGDFQLDEGEPSAITGDGGKADLDVTGINNPKSYPVIVRSIKGKTLDEDTGNTVAADYVMSAPAGEQHVTPLSTLVHVRLETNSSLDKEQAIAEVASELGIDDKEVLGDFIEEKNSEAAFGARNLVSAGILPKTPAELKSEADESAPGTLLTKATTANTTIKTFVEQKKQEAQEQGEELDLSNQLMDKKGNIVSDNDADGVPNTDDFAPDDPEEWLDSDSDGTGDNADSDDDNDNTPDELDAFPFDPTETIDTDGDFIGNNADNDDDNDRVPDSDDAFPLDKTESLDFDKDGIGNNADTDDDNDGTEDSHDAFPFDPTETIDTDGDQIGNNADTDDDNDNVIDTEDSFPLDSSESVDSDNDGQGNNADNDDDNDGTEDSLDAFPFDPSETVDTDGDGIGNNADTDDDNDNVIDTEDSFPLDSSETTDTDGDGIGNNRDTDDDNDGVDDEDDIAPTDPNAGLSDIAKVIAFFQENENIYVPFTDGNDQDGEKLVVEKFIVNGSDASLSNRYIVNADKTLSESSASEDTDLILTENGWTEISEQFAVSMTSDRISVYPASVPEMSYSASGSVKNLSNLSVADNSGEWGENVNPLAHYPEGAAGALISLTADNDIYELDDHSPWFWHGNNGQGDGQNAASLTEIQSSAAAGNGAPVGSVKGISLGYDIGVELVQDGTANYYNWQWQQGTEGTVVLVGSGSWSMKTLHGEEIIEFTVPEAVISQWGNNWHYDSPHLLLSSYQNKVRFGEFTPAGTTEDDDAALLLNTLAYTTLLEAVEVDTSDNGSNGNGSDGSTGEAIDTDGDNIPDNIDSDDDNDNVIDSEDAFPLDSSESQDSDKDGIGNNKDTDDDNDGISDENDIAPTDPNVGLSDIANVITFFQESGNIYVPFTNGNDQEGEKLVVEKFIVNGTDASLATRYVVNADKSLSENPSSEHTEVLMTANGWTTIADQFAVSMSDNRITVYPANAPEMTYTASGAVKDLTEQLIASNSGEWGEKVNQQARYPQGAAGAVLTLTANTDMYELDDHSPWFWHGNNGQDDGQNAVSLTEIQSSTAAGDGAPVGTTKGISLGHEIGVELVQDGTANYYNWQWQQGTVALVGSNSWSMKTINGEEVLEFTVPEAVISQWGNNWNYHTPHLLLSNHDGKVRFGSFTPAGTTENDDSALLMNSIAYSALLEAVDMGSVPASLKTCTTGDSSENSAATKADFEQALADCGGVSEPITSDMLVGKNFHRVNSKGEKRDYTFNYDGTVSVYKNNVEAYKQSWAVSGNYVVLTETWGENNEASSEWIWALLDRNNSQWSVKFYDSETYRNEQNNLVTENFVWSTVFDLQPVNTAPTCNIQEVETGATLEGFNTQLAACSNTLPSVSYANIANGALTRVNSTDQTRAYVFHSDNTATYYKNGQPKSRIWSLDTEGTLKIAANETAEFYDLLRVINEGSGELEFAVFSNEDNAIWKTNYKDFDPNVNLVECEVMNSPWDDANDRPLVFSSYEEFKQSIIECQAIQNGTSDTRIAKFSTDFIGSGIVLAASSDNEYEEYRLNENGTGTYTFQDESENGTEQLAWSIHEDGILKVEINFTDASGVAHTANDYLAIVSTNGIQFSLKIFSQSTEWQSVNPNGGGDLWGGVFSYPIAK